MLLLRHPVHTNWNIGPASGVAEKGESGLATRVRYYAAIRNKMDSVTGGSRLMTWTFERCAELQEDPAHLGAAKCELLVLLRKRQHIARDARDRRTPQATGRKAVCALTPFVVHMFRLRNATSQTPLADDPSVIPTVDPAQVLLEALHSLASCTMSTH
jgi:hypothetical protein